MKAIPAVKMVLLLLAGLIFPAILSGQEISVDRGGRAILTAGIVTNTFSTVLRGNSPEAVVQTGNSSGDSVSLTGDLSGFYGTLILYHGTSLRFNPSAQAMPAGILIGGGTENTTFIKLGGNLSVCGFSGDHTVELRPNGILDLSDPDNTGNLVLSRGVWISGWNDPWPGKIIFRIGAPTPAILLCEAGTFRTDEPVLGQVDVSRHFVFDMEGAAGISGVPSIFIFAHTKEEPFLDGVPVVKNPGEWANFAVGKRLTDKGWDLILSATYRTAVTIQPETAPDGTGSLVTAREVAAGSTVALYAIARDGSGAFVENIPAAWSLTDRTGGASEGDLAASADGRSAIFRGRLTGSAIVHPASNGLQTVSSGQLTVVPGPVNAFTLNPTSCQISGIPFTGTNSLQAIDAFGNRVTGFNAQADPVTLATVPADGIITGLGLALSDQLDQPNDFVDGEAILTGKMTFTGLCGNHGFVATSRSGHVSSIISIHIFSALVVPSVQEFCGQATVAQLVPANPEIRWYAARSGGSTLDSGDRLTDGMQYYAAMASGDCETERNQAAMVIIHPLSAGGSISSDNLTITLGSSTGDIRLGGYTGQIIKWQKRPDPGTWTDLASQVSSIKDTPEMPGTWLYRALVGSGTCPATWSDSLAITVLPYEAVSSITVSMNPVQYSDRVLLIARVSNGAPLFSNVLAATAVNFTFDGRILKDTSGQADIVLRRQGTDLVAELSTRLIQVTGGSAMAPGDKMVNATFLGTNDIIRVRPNPTVSMMTIAPEEARVSYSGDLLVAAPTMGSATVLLQADINDISAEPGGDPFPGDIRNATVSFINRATNAVIGTVPVTLRDGIDIRKGRVQFAWTGVQPGVYTIGLSVGGYYEYEAAADNTVVTVYDKVGDYLTGGGIIAPQNASGKFEPDPGTITNFGMFARFDNTGTILNGDFYAIFRKTIAGQPRVLQMAGSDLRTLRVNINDPEAKTGSYVGDASLTDITDPLRPTDIAWNLRLTVALTDRGTSGVNDDISLTLKSNSTLYYSSSWNFGQTEPIKLSTGNMLINSSFNVDGGTTGIDLTDDGTAIQITAFPNPSGGIVNFKFKIDKASMVNLDIVAIDGTLVTRIFEGYVDANSPKSIVYDSKLPQGIYFYRIKTDSGFRYGKLVIAKTYHTPN